MFMFGFGGFFSFVLFFVLLLFLLLLFFFFDNLNSELYSSNRIL